MSAVVGVDDAAGFGVTVADGHVEGVAHKRGVWLESMDQSTIRRL